MTKPDKKSSENSEREVPGVALMGVVTLPFGRKPKGKKNPAQRKK